VKLVLPPPRMTSSNVLLSMIIERINASPTRRRNREQPVIGPCQEVFRTI
jgi:hypothetical protein